MRYLLTPGNHYPGIDHVSDSIVRAFTFMVDHPEDWYTVTQIVEETGVGRATVYRRFGNLVAAGALLMRRENDQRLYKLHARWHDSPLAIKLHRRAKTAAKDGGTVAPI